MNFLRLVRQMASKREERAVLDSAISGVPRTASSEAGRLGRIHNAGAKLQDGAWLNTGGQAGVQLNIKHAKGRQNYVKDSASRSVGTTNTPAVSKHSVSRGGGSDNAGTTGPRRVGPAPSHSRA